MPPLRPAMVSRAFEEVRRAWEKVPFYKRRGTVPESFESTPLLWKRDVQASLPKSWFPDGLDARALLSSGEVTLAETSGTSGERARVLWAKGAREAQEQEVLSMHPAVTGEGRRAVLGVPSKGMGSCHSGDPSYEDRLEDGVLHLNSRQDPTFWTDTVMDRMLDEIGRHETRGLVADPAYLAELAVHARKRGRRVGVTGWIALTWSTTTGAHAKAIAEVYDGPVFQLHGTRETGALLVETAKGRFASPDARVLLEVLPAKATDGIGLLVVTTLGRSIMPLARYVTGDLVRVSGGAIVGLEGRIQDAVVRPDGAWISAGEIVRALGDLAFQANQRGPGEVELDVVGLQGARARELSASLFPGMKVDVREQSALPAEPSGRFRASRRHFAVPMSDAFEGCPEGVSS